MQRILEPELMDEPVQVLAYAKADFSEPNRLFIDLFSSLAGNSDVSGQAIDLGCGPGDICIRIARAFPQLRILGVDGAPAMLEHAQTALKAEQSIRQRIEFQVTYIPSQQIPASAFDYVISNSLLHHLHDPLALWETVKHCGKPGAVVQVMDLIRPESTDMAHDIVDSYASDEAEVLKLDFFNSLCAAFTMDEVKEQLSQADLAEFNVRQVSNRHLLVSGRLT